MLFQSEKSKYSLYISTLIGIAVFLYGHSKEKLNMNILIMLFFLFAVTFSDSDVVFYYLEKDPGKFGKLKLFRSEANSIHA